MFQWESSVRGKSVFTRENLLAMRDVEAIALAGYEDFCQIEYDELGIARGCVPYLSPLTYFFDQDGTMVDDVDAVVRDVFATNLSAFGYFLGDFDSTAATVGITRAKYPVGTPFRGFVSSSDRPDEQEAMLASFLDPIETALFRRYGMRGSFVSSPYMTSTRERAKGATLITRWDAEFLRERDSARVIASDLAWAIASIAAVWLYMAFNTRSLFIATCGMFEILVSFPIALLIYRFIFRIPYVGNIQALSIFICLGIGADDVFVYFDAFRQSATEAEVGDALFDRLMYSTDRASKAIFVTSFTTTGAFLATAWSPITPLAAFGIVSATMIAVLFVVNVLLFPAALVLFARYFENMTWRQFLPASKEINESEIVESKALGRVERFFHGPFYQTLRRPFVRFVTIGAFTAMFIVAARFCVRLETPSKIERWYSSKHLVQQFSDRDQTAFLRSDDDLVVAVDVFWGLLGVDTSSVSQWDLASRGRLQLDESFDVSAEVSQVHILNSCLTLRHASCSSRGCRDGRLTRDVDCFMEAFRDYVGEENFPVPRDSFLDELWEFRSSSVGSRYAHQIGFRPNKNSGEPELFFVKVSTKSTLMHQAPASVSRGVHDEFEGLIRNLNEVAPDGVKSGSQTAYVAWTWMRMQETLVDNTFQGISICFCMAFVVLCISTGNVLVASICSVSVAGVVVSVLGIGVYRVMHWSLGIRETIAAVILIGLSVDYGVHLGNAYVEAPAAMKSRGDRTQYALATMGVSIVASAVTTVISGSILWLCTLQFFAKFAFLITTTIASSLVWALVFISLLLITLGPEGEDWKLKTICGWIGERACIMLEKLKNSRLEESSRTRGSRK